LINKHELFPVDFAR